MGVLIITSSVNPPFNIQIKEVLRFFSSVSETMQTQTGKQQ